MKPKSTPDTRLQIRAGVKVFTLPLKHVSALVALLRQPEGAIEVVTLLPSLQQTFGFEQFEVGQVPQGGQTEHLEEFPRRFTVNLTKAAGL